jgi:RNA-binding protein
MRRAGDVTRTAQGVAVVRCPDATPPSIGTAVVDDSLAEVGTVVDVFGPVERPLLAVSPVDDLRPVSLVGTTLYARDG